MSFTVTSSDIRDGERLPDAQVSDRMGGGNVSPQLAWSGAPAGTRSFVVTCFDPDAPTGSGWWHWVVANIPADVTALPTGAGSGRGRLPAGAVQCRTDFGEPGYGGAAPPPGPPHRYVFTVHALKVPRIDVDGQSSGAVVGFNVHFNRLASAQITASYGA